MIGSIRSNDGAFLSFEDVGKAISVQRTDDEVTPLHIAAAFGHADAVRALLNAGADPTWVPVRGRFSSFTPYQVAQGKAVSAFHVYLFEQIALGNVETIKQLVKAGIGLSISDGSSTEDTPLHWACSFNKLDVTATLIAGGANVNILNSSKQSPLHILCKLPPNAEKVELLLLLLQEGADASLEDSKGLKAEDLVKDTDKDALLALNSNPLPTMEHTNRYAQSGLRDPDELEAVRASAVAIAQEYVLAKSTDNPGDPPRSATATPTPVAVAGASAAPAVSSLAVQAEATVGGTVRGTPGGDVSTTPDANTDEYDFFDESAAGAAEGEECTLPQLHTHDATKKSPSAFLCDKAGLPPGPALAMGMLA